MKPVSVAFICTHNACRSQMAEAVARSIAADAIAAHSAGTHPVEAVNADAIRTLEAHGMDSSGLHPKTLNELPAIDIVVTMGCGVSCPTLPARHREDWSLEDPGKGDEAFADTFNQICEHMLDLRARILAGAFDTERHAANLKALGDPNRLRILRLLSGTDELCACELLRKLDISQPTLSHHMSILCGSAVVIPRKEGRWMHYKLDCKVLQTLGSLIGRIAQRDEQTPSS